jgi:hypothetical protein
VKKVAKEFVQVLYVIFQKLPYVNYCLLHKRKFTKSGHPAADF